jgi:hypothetical protein
MATTENRLSLEDQLMEVELVILAASLCSSLSAHCVSAIPGSITAVLLYRETNGCIMFLQI